MYMLYPQISESIQWLSSVIENQKKIKSNVPILCFLK